MTSKEGKDESAPELDVDMLKQMVSSRLKRICVTARRLTRGSYNEIYLLHFDDNGSDCICVIRLSRDLDHPSNKFASEIATMKYVAQNTSIRVPEVYDWDSGTQNDIKVPYIVMEYIPGTHLYKVWDKMNVEQTRNVLSQIVDVLSELWKCKFEKLGCIYSNSHNSAYEIGPIVSPLYYIEGRNDIPDVLSYTGPFESTREWFCNLIRKEKQFFTNHGVQELIKIENLNEDDAKKRVEELKKNLDSLQSKLSEDNPFDDLIDKPPFALVHGDFDAQNMLVDDNFNIIGIIDWEFSRTGTLWDICKYPIWIREFEESRVLNDAEVEKKRKKKELRDHFCQEMVAKLGAGDISEQILDRRERDEKIKDLGSMFTRMVHRFDSLENLLKCFFKDYP